MNLDANLATESLEARIAEELEERTEFCDWLSVLTSCCGGGGTTSCTNAATCSVTSSTSTTTSSKGW